MSHPSADAISIVVPVYNEGAGLERFHRALIEAVQDIPILEIIYCDDGSHDNTADIVHDFHTQDARVHLLKLTRNFGKEIAITAGIHTARGAAIVTLDADGQHPVELIPRFVDTWHHGARVVTGRRIANQNEGFIKRIGSKLFYKIFNSITGIHLEPGATDFRLIDKTVQQEFMRMNESNRITRGLVDWLGYPQTYIDFTAHPRLAGEATYSVKKLFKLAVDSILSLSTSPLYVTAYIGAFILPTSLLLGLGMCINALFGDPLNLHATGGAYVLVLLLFLIGILMMSQGIIGLYLSRIHTETQHRPLFVIDTHGSTGTKDVA